MMPVLAAMNQTVTAEILAGAEAGTSAVTMSGICFLIMPEGALARGEKLDEGAVRFLAASRRPVVVVAAPPEPQRQRPCVSERLCRQPPASP
jgi:hypothetical protein